MTTNIHHLFTGVDARTKPVSRYQRTLSQVIDQLGGPSKVTPSDYFLVQRLAALVVIGDRLERQLITNDPKFNIDSYLTFSNSFMRLCRDLDVLPNKSADDGTPNLEDFMEDGYVGG